MQLITFREYNPRWSEFFEREQDVICRALGQAVEKIHHIGSTAVPDLLSKAIIDITIESRSFPPPKALIDKLASIEYEYRGEAGVPGRHWFVKGSPRRFNLHFCEVQSDVVRKQLKFRDKLIAEEKLRREYEALKLNNYLGKDIDSTSYADAKTQFIYKVIGFQEQEEV